MIRDRGSQGSQIMLCSTCHKVTAANQAFCAHCGHDLRVRCLRCGNENLANARHCGVCAAVMQEVRPAGQIPDLAPGERRQVTATSGHRKFARFADAGTQYKPASVGCHHPFERRRLPGDALYPQDGKPAVHGVKFPAGTHSPPSARDLWLDPRRP